MSNDTQTGNTQYCVFRSNYRSACLGCQ